MIDYIFKGVISIDTTDDAFVKDFNKFLESNKAKFKGTLEVIKYDDAEIVDD